MLGATATILIPDISGFTEFMTSTELSHSSFAISMLINTIIDAVGDEYEISEIEGDAVLMFKRGPAPSHKEIQDICLKIFNAFHFQRKWMQQHAVCPCKACKEITNLTLKFVAHHGPVGEIKAGRFTKLSGTDVIVAHRLLKNSVSSQEYVLMTETLSPNEDESQEGVQMNWARSFEEYAAIGRVDYRYALLSEQRKNTPDPEVPLVDYPTERVTAFFELPVAANYLDAYMVMMNIPNRSQWMPHLQKVEQDIPAVFVGSIHYCTFDDHQAVISPLRMGVSEKEISYAESCRIETLGLFLVHEFVFTNIDDDHCILSCRVINAGSSEMPMESSIAMSHRFEQMAKSLKQYFER